MSAPPRAVADIRRAVRESLVDLNAGSLVLVAVSGGADSMALAAATKFVAPRAGLRHTAVVIDHGLQAESGRVAQQTALSLQSLGYDTVHVRKVDVNGEGGLEAAARDARYQAIDDIADACAASVVLLGHTLDDQAETVLLGLGRGSGARSIRGMARSRGRYRRPLLGVRRSETRECCLILGLPIWDDPHNQDQRFRRVRVRTDAIPALETALGPGVAEALARTADQVADDDDALQAWADDVVLKARLEGLAGHEGLEQPECVLDVEALAAVPAAVRRRVIRGALLDAGVPGGSLRASQVMDVDALISLWKGQGEVHLPGGVRATRSCGRLSIARDQR